MYMVAASLGLGSPETYAYPPATSSGLITPDDGLGAARNCAAAKMYFPAPPVAVADEYCFLELGAHPPAYYDPTPPPPQMFSENEMKNMGFVDDGRMTTTTMVTMNRTATAAGSNVVGHQRHRTTSSSPRIGFRTRSAVDVLDDGFRWRKYGKKAVKSSPNPRNYYRCAVEGCGVKKRVERDRHDPRYVLTTYDGVHNHATAPPPGCAGGAGAVVAGHRAPPQMAVPPYTAAEEPVALAGAPNSDAWGMHHQLHAAATAHSSESSY